MVIFKIVSWRFLWNCSSFFSRKISWIRWFNLVCSAVVVWNYLKMFYVSVNGHRSVKCVQLNRVNRSENKRWVGCHDDSRLIFIYFPCALLSGLLFNTSRIWTCASTLTPRKNRIRNPSTTESFHFTVDCSVFELIDLFSNFH